MGKTFLMSCLILIKRAHGHVRGSPGNPLLLSLYPFVPFPVTGKIQRFPVRSRTYKNIHRFSIYFCIGTVRMHDWGKKHFCKKFFRSCSVFAANSWHRLLTIPFEIFSFPSVRSHRNFLLLSMEVQHSLFSRKRNARTLPP